MSKEKQRAWTQFMAAAITTRKFPYIGDYTSYNHVPISASYITKIAEDISDCVRAADEAIKHWENRFNQDASEEEDNG